MKAWVLRRVWSHLEWSTFMLTKDFVIIYGNISSFAFVVFFYIFWNECKKSKQCETKSKWFAYSWIVWVHFHYFSNVIYTGAILSQLCGFAYTKYWAFLVIVSHTSQIHKLATQRTIIKRQKWNPVDICLLIVEKQKFTKCTSKLSRGLSQCQNTSQLNFVHFTFKRFLVITCTWT